MTTDQYIDPQDVKILPTALRYGLIGSLISIMFGLIIHILDLNDMSNPNSAMNWVITLANWGIIIGTIFLAIKHHKNEELGGYITMGRGIGTGVLTTLVIAVIGMVWGYIFFTMIDPGLVEEIMGAQMAAMEDQGLTDEQIEASRQTLETFSSPGIMAFMAMIMSLIFGTIVSLISAAILKRENPMA